jgi:3-hydroxyacyl-[acyl-carrier-protein] dehydratase
MRFYLLDKITEWNPGKNAKGLKAISLSEDFFGDHFPRYPIMPGVLILEALAQLSGLLLEATIEAQSDGKLKRKALISIMDKVKFRNIARPGDVLELQTVIESIRDDSGKVRTVAMVGEKRIAETTMTFVLTEFNDADLERTREQLMKFWLEDRR